jgi:hypothetical protein
MPIRVKTGSATWANVTELRVKTAISTWSDVIKGRVKTAANVWSDFFTAVVTPTIQTRVQVVASGGISGSTIMSDSTSVTLTSTRFHWIDADGFTYIWQKSSNNSIWEDIGTAQSTSNPASGSSSSSITKVLSGSDFTSGPDMYFRFKSMATNSTYSTSGSSESLSVLVSYYGTPTPNSPFPSITGSTTVGNTAIGNIGTWTNSPTSYDYRWFFMSGATSYPLTFSQARSVSNKSLSGFSASLVTSASHGYKVNDDVVIAGMDSLFNGTQTITAKTNNTISFTLPTPTAFSITVSVSSGAFFSFNGSAYQAVSSLSASSAWTNAGTAYSIGDNVYYNSNRYRANSSLSGISAYNGGTIYSSGAIVYSGSNRYQSTMNNNIGNSVTNYIYWTDLGSYAPGLNSMWTSVMPGNASFWTLQSFSNAVASGTTTAPNYYEATVGSSTSISLTVPTVDYRSQLDMIDKSLYFGVKAYNPATLSPSEYSNYKLVYGVPVITLGTPTYPSSTTAQIPFTSSYAAKYNVDVIIASSSLNPYPITTTPATSPINISGLTAGFTYTVNVYPINGEDTYGSLKTTPITLPNAPGVPTNLTRTTGNAGSKTFSWSAPSSGGTVVSYQYQLNSLGWINNGTATSVSLTGLSGSNTFQVRAVGSSLTGTAASTGSFTIPTINSGPTSSSVTSSSATISWTSTNQSSWSLSGVGSYSGSSQTSQSVSLSASSSYTPTLVITSSTGDTATTTGAPFSTPAQSFTVIFNANGGTGTMANQTANTATNLTAFGFTPPAGQAFSGWSTSAGGSVVYANQASYPFTSSTTLYAIYYTLPTAPSQPSPSSSSITQTSATVSWTAPAGGGSAITRYEAQLNSSGYSNIGLVLTQNLSGLTAGTSYTYYVRAVNAVGPSTSGSVTFTTTAAPVIPSVTQIQSTNTNAGPTFMSFAITCANALSCDVRVDRAASSATAPTSSYTAGTSTLLTLTGNTGTVNSATTAAPAGSNAWYRIRVIPYTALGRTGTPGAQVASSWKRNTATSSTTTNPSPTPFGDPSV